ncbi:RDD family protein [Micromonospora vulcania]|uniref:RDD family protein n=1 Tax=Micromonospora vulcania TaxID=1441873 RepID=A0ABW1H6Y1_9ACTN
MTQPPSYPMPPVGGPSPTAGGVTPPPGHPQGYAVPPQYAPPGYAPPPWYPGPPRPMAPPPTLSPGGQPLASFSDRLLAWLIDMALASGVALVLFLPAFAILFWRMVTKMSEVKPDGTVMDPDPSTIFLSYFLPILLLQVGMFVLLLGLYWLYHVEYLKRDGQTLGKKAMKLRVVPLDPTRTLNRAMAGRRWLVQHLAVAFVPGLNYLDGFWQLWDKPWQQCLHDKFAETVVVKVSE